MTEQRQTVTLAPGEFQEVIFKVVPIELGHYTVVVNGLSGSFDVVSGAIYTIGDVSWDALMPFAPSSGHVFNVFLTNLGDKRFLYRMEVYWISELVGNFGGSVSPGGTGGGGTKVWMPSESGIYNLTIKSWIDGIYAGEFVVSKVRVAEYYQPGDANGDDVIDMADVTKVERIILGVDPPTLEADANQDGEINMADVTKIERIILGIDPIPVPVPIP